MKIIDGKKIADSIKENIRNNVIELEKKNIIPSLAIIMVGDNPASEIYVRNKVKAAENLGIKAITYRFTEDFSDEDIIKKIKDFNNDEKIHGIIVQSPLPKKFNEEYITSFISSSKDVDGFGTLALGNLLSNNEGILAATPKGIIKMLEYENIPISGANVVIVGRSKIVGRPLMTMLLNRDATVTITHSKTKNLKEITNKADILIVAIGKREYITSDFIKEGAVVIDVGINKVNDKVVGDVNFIEASKKASYITPVPGGVGPMTIAMLLENTVNVAMKNIK